MTKQTNTNFSNPLAQFGYGVYTEFHEYLKKEVRGYDYHYMHRVLNGPRRSKGFRIEKAAIKFAAIKRAENEEARKLIQAL